MTEYRRHRPAGQDAAPPADPMAVDWPAGGPAGGVDEATTDDEHARAQPTPHALAAPSGGEASGAPPPPHDSGGAPTPMAVDPVEPPETAAMRANDEMQQTTIGGDSDEGMAEGNTRLRRGKRKTMAAKRLAAWSARQAPTGATSGGDDDDGSECMLGA